MVSKNIYAVAVGSGLLGSAVNALASLGLIWLLNSTLGKAGFGTIILAITVLEVVTAILASGFVSVILFRVSRLSDDSLGGPEAIRSMIGTILFYGVLVAILVAIIVAISSNLISSIFDKPALTYWIYSMSVIVPLDVARRILVEGCRAQQKIQLAVLFGEVVPSLLRATMVGVVFIFTLDESYVVLAYLIAQTVPVFALVNILRPKPLIKNSLLSKSDVYYGLKLTLNRLANEPNRSIDILMVGALTSASVTAEYALASRIAKLLVVVKTAFGRLLVPRLAGGIEEGKFERINREYGLARLFSLIATLIGVVGICAVGPYVLPLFGDYSEAFAILMILAAAMVVRVGVGSSGGYLNMAGYAGYTLLSTVLGLGINIFLALLLIPILSASGGALSVLISTVTIQIMIGLFLWSREQFTVIDLASLNAVFLAVILALVAAYSQISSFVIATILACISAAYIYSSKNMWEPLLPNRMSK